MSSRQSSGLTLRDVTSHLAVMVALSALMGLLVAGLVIPFAGALGIGAKSISQSVKDLPEDLQAEPLAQRTRVLDSTGKTIATFYDQNRVNVSLKRIAPIMRQAIVAIEDDRFYEHGAFDPKGTLRAFLTNQASNGVTQGGSSITQQMVKMTLLNQATTKAEREAATADTYQRKIKELRYALGVELRGRYLRRPVRSAALLRGRCQSAQPAPGRAAGRTGEEPGRLRPHQLPGQGQGTS
jgi:membrane peptidoglycan carboxypeptidase